MKNGEKKYTPHKNTKIEFAKWIVIEVLLMCSIEWCKNNNNEKKHQALINHTIGTIDGLNSKKRNEIKKKWNAIEKKLNG